MSYSKNSDKLTVVMYHYVRDLAYSRYPGIKGCDVQLFKEQIGYIKKYYNPVTVEQVMECQSTHQELPDHPILLTFDDGYADHFDYVFPILYHEHIQGAFFAPVKAITEHTVLDVNKIHFILAATPQEQFDTLLSEIKHQLDVYRDEYDLKSYEYYFNKLAVPNRWDSGEVIFVKRLLQRELDEDLRKIITDIIFQKVLGVDEDTFSRELYMSMDQIKCMVDCGMHIGSHGYDHYWLGSLSKEKQEFEIAKSIDFIKEVGGDALNWTICYPYGNYNDDTIALLKKHGCKMGFTCEVALADFTTKDIDVLFKIPRLDVNDLPKDSHAAVNEWY